FTPSGYKWKPKSGKENVNPSVSMPLGNASRTANILEPMTSRSSTVSNTPLSSNSFVARRDYPIHQTVKFGNDQIAHILGYGDLVQRAVTITRVYYVEGLNHNLFSVGQLSQFILRCAAKVPLFFLAEAITTTCFTQNCSLVIPQREKTPYHIINDRKPLVKFFHIFGSLCYIVRDGENLDKMKEKCDACIFMSSDPGPECQKMALEHDSLSPGPQCQDNVTQADRTVTTSNELDLLFSPMFDELLNGSSKVVSKPSAVASTDAHNQQMVEVYVQVENDEFINIFCTPVQDGGETSSHHVDLSNMHTFYQHHPSEHCWTKDHPLEQVIRNPLQYVRTRRQLESDSEMYMFALIVSQTELKNIKEAMADSAWIETM
nr:hypothetical protein [Tanacetum cinerariifolium]